MATAGKERGGEDVSQIKRRGVGGGGGIRIIAKWVSYVCKHRYAPISLSLSLTNTPIKGYTKI